MQESLVVEPSAHAAGEYFYTPNALTLSVYEGAPLLLEQVADAGWEGVALRGDVKVMVPGQERTFRHRETAKFVCVTLADACFGELIAPSQLRPRTCLRDPVLTHLVAAAVRAVEGATSSRLFRDAAGRAIAARLADLEGAVPEEPPRRLPARDLARVLEYMRAHIADHISIDSLAEVAGMRPSHFSTMFRRSVGEPPHRHLLRLRVERARTLLESGTTPSTAAIEAGFCDQSHLARQMRRFLGVTPSIVARRARRS